MFGNLRSCNQSLRTIITSSVVASNIDGLQFWHNSLELTKDIINFHVTDCFLCRTFTFLLDDESFNFFLIVSFVLSSTNSFVI